MKRTVFPIGRRLFAGILLSALLAGAGCTSLPPYPQAVPDEVSYVTFNIGGGASSQFGFEQPFDLPRAGACLKSIGADFVALQEVDTFVGRNRNPKRDTAADLAKAAGYPWYSFGKAIPLRGGAYGIALLSRHTPISVGHFPLKDPEEPRTFIDARFRMRDGRILAVCATHLTCGNDAARAQQIQTILNHYKAYPADRLLLAGDLNDAADAPALKLLETELPRLSPDTEAMTWLGGGKAIDHIYGRGLPGERWTVLPGSGRLPYTGQKPLSDHMPVYVHARLTAD